MERLKPRGLLKSFGRVGSGNFARMQREQIEGRNNSWFTRWYASLALAGRLSLAPTRPLINDIGLDGTGMHCSKWALAPFRVEPSVTVTCVTETPFDLDEGFEAALQRFVRQSKMLPYVNEIYRLILEVLMRFGINLERFNGKR